MKYCVSLFIVLLSLYMAHAQELTFNYICPVPGSQYINPGQVIILKTGQPYDARSLDDRMVIVRGSVSGEIPCRLSLSVDSKTLFVHPSRLFALGEKVTVTVSEGLATHDGRMVGSTIFEFTIKTHAGLFHEKAETCCHHHPAPGATKPVPVNGTTGGARSNNLPPDYPAPTYVFTGDGVAEGYIFFTPNVRLTPQYNEYISIWDNYGTPLFYQKISKNITDFKVLDDGILTYAINGLQNPELDCYYLMNSNYEVYDSVRAGNGYPIDNHDILLLENGHFLILIYDQQVVNMSLIVPGGNPNALVTGLVIQEVDINRNVYFQWRSWDHYEITDATWDISLTSMWIDYVHANALEIDADGHILVSCRNMDEITKIDFNTGEIIWRLGINAKNNEFDFNNDPIGFSHQHDIRKLPNGNYTVYDNGNLHVPQYSRALEYHLNESSRQANLVWSYVHDPVVYAPVTGSNQRLPNNNRLVGWGGASPIAMTEVNQNNQVVFELYLPDSVTGYRSLKFPWETTVFSTESDVDFGNYAGYTGPKRYLLQIINNYSQPIQVTGTHNRNPDVFTTGGFPVPVPALGSAEIWVDFQPYTGGNYEDILTINYDNFNNTKRIAKQLQIKGRWDAALPSLQFSPGNLAVGVDPLGVITVTFSEPVRKILGQELKDTDVPNLFIFRKNSLYGSAVGFHGTVSDDKTVITLFPDEPLMELQRYFIRQKPGLLEDYEGNLVNYSDYCFFTTGNYVGVSEDPAPGSQVRVFPNPLTNRLHIITSPLEISHAGIYTEDGKSVYREQNLGDMAIINTEGFPTGILNVSITTTDGARHARKVVKQ